MWRHGRSLGGGTTNAAGDYVTPFGLPSGAYYLRTTNTKGYFNQLYLGVECINCIVTTGAAVPVTAGEVTQHIDFALRKGRQIRGQVVDAQTGHGLTNTSVNFYNTAGVFVASGGTNTTGEYVVGAALSPEQRRATAIAPTQCWA